MSSDETPDSSTPRSSREAVREKAQRVHAQQSRARIMRRIILGTLALVAIGAIGTAVTLAVSAQVSKPQLSPSGMDGDGVVISSVSSAAASAGVPATPSAAPTDAATEPEPTPEPSTAEKVDIHIYVDYLSDDAGEFERTNARLLTNWINEGAVTVTYHPVALLTASSNGTKYSLRAAAASACVATYSADQFWAYNHELLDDQPEINTDGMSDTELADLAGAVGVEDAKKVRSCIVDGDFLGWAKDATTRALEGPLAGSDDLVLKSAPMVVVNGEAYVGALDDSSEFSSFVLTASSEASYKATEAPTPTPTPTPSETPAS
ncbi:thioredoxin domain-containing protein [uncultured Microbacterium sp.]|uniref:DsbA family protein n=1 Tax=uncultured Microbacterium sp. TaxID=191216 RepID=UPI0028DC5847|nr:thioredoxin domain-containing protein [uncultured Microbacterium sp.]